MRAASRELAQIENEDASRTYVTVHLEDRSEKTKYLQLHAKYTTLHSKNSLLKVAG